MSTPFPLSNTAVRNTIIERVCSFKAPILSCNLVIAPKNALGLHRAVHAMDQSVPENLPSRLESLPTELLEAILSASQSKIDLHALVSASPTIYRDFLSAKRTVFVSILVRDLGPALQDTLAVATLAPAKIEHPGDEGKRTRIIQR